MADVQVGDTVKWRHFHRCGRFGVREVIWEGKIVKVYARNHMLHDYVRVTRKGKRWTVCKKHLVKGSPS